MTARGPKKIARGAFASVYKATYKGIVVVVKELHQELAADPKMRQFLIHEIEMNMSIKHPNIARVFGGWDTYNDDEGIYPSMVVEFVPLKLSDVLSNPDGHSFTQEKKKAIIYQLASCLMNLHTRNPPVYHCDLKPENIMLTDDLAVKLIDFGIAKVERMTLLTTTSGYSTSSVKGTPGFMVFCWSRR
jgi:serine/threonine-protein kinase